MLILFGINQFVGIFLSRPTMIVIQDLKSQWEYSSQEVWKRILGKGTVFGELLKQRNQSNPKKEKEKEKLKKDKRERG